MNNSFFKSILKCLCSSWCLIFIDFLFYYILLLKEIAIPDDPKLPQVDRHPKVIRKPDYARKRKLDFRGPELTVNYLLFKNCGIQATSGGMLKFEHFEVMFS